MWRSRWLLVGWECFGRERMSYRRTFRDSLASIQTLPSRYSCCILLDPSSSRSRPLLTVIRDCMTRTRVGLSRQSGRGLPRRRGGESLLNEHSHSGPRIVRKLYALNIVLKLLLIQYTGRIVRSSTLALTLSLFSSSRSLALAHRCSDTTPSLLRCFLVLGDSCGPPRNRSDAVLAPP